MVKKIYCKDCEHFDVDREKCHVKDFDCIFNRDKITGIVTVKKLYMNQNSRNRNNDCNYFKKIYFKELKKKIKDIKEQLNRFWGEILIMFFLMVALSISVGLLTGILM